MNMAQESGEKPGSEASNRVLVSKLAKGWVIPLLRVFSFLAMASATIVMAINKETQTFVVATIGSTPIKVTLTAKFQHTPAFVFFVVANGIGSLHNLLMLAVNLIGYKYDFKGFAFLITAILDMLTVALVSGGAVAAVFLGELGRNGNSHARWNKICDKFDTFCDHGAGAMLASLIGLLILIIINIISIIKIANINCAKNSVVP